MSERTAHMEPGAFGEWFAGRARAHHYRVRRLPLAALDGWRHDPVTGDLGHVSGRFFSVAGLRVRTDHGPVRSWGQPVIMQPEVGVLGILVKDFDGVRHCLMQAKMEPGNINTLQLSPTVQATRSNYTGVHRGRSVPYLEYFTGPRRGRVIADVLHSEQGAWFLHKRNRNMVVETGDDVPVGDDFCWLPLSLVRSLLGADNVVNMDARTVLSCLPPPPFGAPRAAAAVSTELLSWITSVRATREVVAERIPLRETERWSWHTGAERIAHSSGRWFTVVGVGVSAGSREVARWSQPLLAPVGTGLAGMLVRYVGGVPELLLRARTEAGTLNVAELGPTVQCVPKALTREERSEHPFLAAVAEAPPERVRHDALLSEEGGRFLDAVTRYRLVEAGTNLPALPDDYRWVSLPEITALLRHSNYVNVQARTLVACLHAAICP